MNEIESKIEATFQIKSNSTSDLKQVVDDLKSEDSEQEIDDFIYQQMLDFYIRIKEDQTLLQEDIPRLRALLNSALSKLTELNNGSFSETKFGSKLKGPNIEFIELLDQNILSTESNIYSTYNNVEYHGQLTNDGYFTILTSNEFKPFSSLSTAASFVCKKTIQKGWEFWFSKDKDGNEQNMQYFRRKLKLNTR